MRKKFANWHLWIFIDVLAIGVYVYKQIYLTVALYVVFLILAIGGFIEWQKTLKEEAHSVGLHEAT